MTRITGDVCIRAWNILIDQTVKRQVYSRQWRESLVGTIFHNPMKRISPNFGHVCIWVRRCGDYSFWGQSSKFKVTAAKTRKQGEYNNFVNIFSKVGSCMYLRLIHTD